MSSRKVDVNTIVARLGSLLDKVLKSNVELSLSTGEVPLVKADPNLIEQVVMNLCLNACDAMPEGGRLTVGTQTATLDESYCRFYPYISPGRYVVPATFAEDMYRPEVRGVGKVEGEITVVDKK